MDPELLTALVRAGNDGVIPAPLAGEDMRAYKFRAACAGAVVAVQWQEKTMAERRAQHEEADRLAKEEAERVRADIKAQAHEPSVRRNDAGFDGAGLGEHPPISGAAMGGRRPDDDTGTSPARTPTEIDRILRPGHLNGAGTRGDQTRDEIGVD